MYFPHEEMARVTDSFTEIHGHHLKYCNPLLLDVCYLSLRARELCNAQSFLKTVHGINLEFFKIMT